MADETTDLPETSGPKDLESFFKMQMAGPKPRHEFHGDIQYTPEGNMVISFESYDSGAATFKLTRNTTELVAFREKPKPKTGKEEMYDCGCASVCDY